jgi:hypothetical protein
MRGRSWNIAEGAAHLLDRSVVEPALRNTLFDGPAVGANLAAPDVMMPALVVEYEEAHGIGLPIEPIGIENNDARCGRTQIGQPRVENVAQPSTPKRSTGNQ